MKIEIVDINTIKPYENNPRKLKDSAIEKVAKSIKEFGFRQPIVVDKEKIIVVGHTRYRASKKLGLTNVPITIADNLTPEQINAYRIADNRTNEEAEWDIELLKDYIPNSVISPNQIEPTPSMFKQFHIKDCGRDPKTFSLENYWKYEEPLRGHLTDESGSTLPIFMSKIDYLRLGGWDENYEMGMVADWDFFLKCQLSGLKMLRTYECHFYHFVSLSTTDSPEKQLKRQQSEQNGHAYAHYKWGNYIRHNPENNLKYI